MFNSVAKYLWGGSTNNEQDYTDRNTLEEQHGSGERLETQQEEDWEVVRTADKENSLERALCGPHHRHLHCHHTHLHNHHHHHSHAQQLQAYSLGGHEPHAQTLPGTSDAELLDDAAALAWSMSIGDSGQYLTDFDPDSVLCPLHDCGCVNLDFDKISDTESLPESVFSACSGRSHATYQPSGHRSEPWVVAPPPCFTGSKAGELSPVASSPLENLLIEHPSMSVYLSFPLSHPFLCNRPAGEITNSDLQRTENEESSEQPVVNDQVQVQNDDQRRAHSNVLRPINIDVHAAIHPGPFSPQHLVKSVHLAQRLQHTKAQKMISKSKCERQNKVREYHGHAKGNSRRNKHLCPSGFRSSRFSQRV